MAHPCAGVLAEPLLDAFPGDDSPQGGALGAPSLRSTSDSLHGAPDGVRLLTQCFCQPQQSGGALEVVVGGLGVPLP